MTRVAVESVCARWADAGWPAAYRGELAYLDLQGMASGRCGDTDGPTPDASIASLLGISRTHAALLREVSMQAERCELDGECMSNVLLHPEKIIGPNARLVLEFWYHLDMVGYDAEKDVCDPGWYSPNRPEWKSHESCERYDALEDAESAVLSAWESEWNTAITATTLLVEVDINPEFTDIALRPFGLTVAELRERADRREKP